MSHFTLAFNNNLESRLNKMKWTEKYSGDSGWEGWASGVLYIFPASDIDVHDVLSVPQKSVAWQGMAWADMRVSRLDNSPHVGLGDWDWDWHRCVYMLPKLDPDLTRAFQWYLFPMCGHEVSLAAFFFLPSPIPW